ncbi:MAG: Ribonuclease Y [Opitutia bacterium UBA7350]|nr:MAG: Ribonuclease Y [Opitutae bacterium UBA7350]
MDWNSHTGILALVLLTAAVVLWLVRRQYRALLKAQEKSSEVALREAELGLREKESANAVEFRSKAVEQELKARELAQLESKILLEREQLELKAKEIEEAHGHLKSHDKDTEKARRLYREKLSEVSKMDAEEAREVLIKETRKECETELRSLRQEYLSDSESTIKEEAQRILLAAMQRITSKPMHDASATVVSLPEEALKGRIIGKDGRNIRTFEHATGTTLLIDEAPDSVLISSFDPVRREIARIALAALLRDGRIQPASIEEAVITAQEEMDSSIIQFGETAMRRLRLNTMHPEIVGLLGKLHYRLSNNQNTLEHSIEVANICALLASEVGLDPRIAKRAGLLHDLGKAVDEDFSSSHAIAGADIARRCGEDKRVVNAIAAHHKEVPAESVYAGLVMVGDSLSAVRPGVRTSSIDSFIGRVRSIEAIAQAEKGVSEAFAIQSGREVRVIVDPGTITDEEAQRIARRIRGRIESELNYPGSIEITVIREQRYKETAV